MTKMLPSTDITCGVSIDAIEATLTRGASSREAPEAVRPFSVAEGGSMLARSRPGKV